MHLKLVRPLTSSRSAAVATSVFFLTVLTIPGEAAFSGNDPKAKCAQLKTVHLEKWEIRRQHELQLSRVTQLLADYYANESAPSIASTRWKTLDHKRKYEWWEYLYQKEQQLDKEVTDISVDVLVLSGMPRAKAERQRYLNSFQGYMYLKSKYGNDYLLSPESINAQMDMYVVKAIPPGPTRMQRFCNEYGVSW
jgi:hypothetical protein